MSFKLGNSVRYGAVIEDRIVDLTERMPEYAGLRELLQAGALVRAQDIAAESSADYQPGEVEFLSPIPDPQKIICIGVNYAERDAELAEVKTPPQYPSVFIRSRQSLVGHLAPIIRPPESTQLDYEGEIALVISTAGRRISEADAHSYIAGLTLMNEGTIRDWLRHGAFNVTQGKNFEGSGSIGPWFVTTDEFANLEHVDLTCSVNGEVRQQDNTSNLRFSFAHLIAYLSTFMRLQPGDIIATGTPAGAGAHLDPPRFLVPGDRIEVTSPEIGVLRNEVADEEISTAG